MTARPAISIPQPCHVSWAAMSPTEAGRHCATCATEVVDFTRLSEAEILAFLARQGGRPVCANARATQLAPPLLAPRWRRWLVAGLALLGWQSATSCTPKPPQTPPATATTATAATEITQGTLQALSETKQVVIRGQVLDGADGSTVAGVRVLINDTEFGTTTDGKGNFELVMARNWAPIAGGKVSLKFFGNPFDFKEQGVVVDVSATPQPAPLVVKMTSVPNRGNVMGKIRMPEPPVAPPKG